MAKRPAFKPHPAAARAAHAGSGSAYVPAMLLAFGCGTGTAVLLLAMLAFVLERFNVPLNAVPPMAVAAAWAGAAVSGWVLGSKIGRLHLACGLGCGVFYCLCLLLAGFLMCGTVVLEGANLAVPIALLLGGLAGGTLSALRTVTGTLPH